MVTSLTTTMRTELRQKGYGRAHSLLADHLTLLPARALAGAPKPVTHHL